MVFEDLTNLRCYEIWADWEEGGIHKGIFGVHGVVLRFCSSVFRLI